MTDFYLGDCVVDTSVEKAKSNFLKENEILLGAFSGTALRRETGTKKGCRERDGYLLITDKRVMFWDCDFLAGSTGAFCYGDIAAVESSQGFILGNIVLNVRGTRERFKNVWKDEVMIVVKMIQEMMEKHRQPIAN